jgi:pyruvate/2-oxoglutarate dehydrogenase complex dihydrolipoamide dehydrogenase (E3) component
MRARYPVAVRECGVQRGFQAIEGAAATIMRMDAPPRRLAVLGGGYIAAELAQVFAAPASEIVIVARV